MINPTNTVSIPACFLAVIIGVCDGGAASASDAAATRTSEGKDDGTTGELTPNISFNRDVRPILSDRCFKCHGPDAENQDSDLRLDTHENAVADLGGYQAIVPGDLEASELYLRIHSDDEDLVMPPADSLRGLSKKEKQILDQWILQGAPYERHWSFETLPKSVAVPPIDDPWVTNPIDRFVMAAMHQQNVAPADPASKEKWLRRVTFDLTGLPPTLDQIDAFIADDSQTAFETVVDRLLTSDACAERLTSEWLDVARYSDSFGYQRDDARYVWPYRDWVIDAFRQNMPYDQFITWQVGGDLMPDATEEQVLATTFNRLHSHKKEGGVALEEFRIENVADRTQTFAAAFLGLTLECSRCHDHKYDPITMKDYYSLSSFFANVDERGLISYFTDAVPTPAMPLPTDEQRQRLEQAGKDVAAAQNRYDAAIKAAHVRFEQWLDQIDGDESQTQSIPDKVAALSFDQWVPATEEESVNETGKKVSADSMRAMPNEVDADHRAVTPDANQLVDGRRGKAIRLTGDDAVVLPGMGHYERHQPFSVSLWIRSSETDQRAVIYRRSRGWDDAGSIGYELTKLGDKLSAKLVHFWPGDAICVETTEPIAADRWYHVAVTYDGSSKASGLKIFIDGSPADTKVVQDHLTRNITQWRQGYNDFAIGSRYRDRGFKDGMVDDFALFQRCLSPIEVRQCFDGRSLSDRLATSPDQWSADDRQQMLQYFVSAIDPSCRSAMDELTAAREEYGAAMDATEAITIMREQSEPRPAYILNRGVYDQRGDQVSADTPEFLPPFPDSEPRNRLGLARWLTDPDHPLTARVVVNRYWQLLFGNGLVRTPEDFGNQGEPPTHPELLDWLARDLVDHGWDLRRLLRMMVLSSTYRQTSVVDPERRQADPENRWLARGPDQRLSAEMIRDNALAVSGLLVRDVGGPPVKPYDVALAYTPLPVDEGAKLYRRSLYTFWKRTSPSPVMMTMNASKREVCRVRREVTASPLQALVLMNGPQFTEASLVAAANWLAEFDGDTDTIICVAFRSLTGREPNQREQEILSQLVDEQTGIYRSKTDLAKQFVQSASQVDTPPQDTARWAAVAVMVNAVMNLDECVRHQ
ncbi:DUF1553 domain-containing protein [Crateriforma spongiae]|uniref:DUF1553 domain-containing protein n=1 Tax=Crateriforma spongiae TaxID=2724528 RepID=UPI0039AEB592